MVIVFRMTDHVSKNGFYSFTSFFLGDRRYVLGFEGQFYCVSGENYKYYTERCPVRYVDKVIKVDEL